MASFPLPTAPSKNSSILDRVKTFLPVIAKANADLEEKLKNHEDIPQIDSSMLKARYDADIPELDGDSSVDEDDSESSDEDFDSEAGPVIQLDFALGNFDSTVIAQLEDEKEQGDEKDEET